MKCPYAPINELKAIVKQYKRHISVLPLLEKGEEPQIRANYDHLHRVYFPYSSLSESRTFVHSILDNPSFELYFKREEALAFLLCSKLNGNRHIGSMGEIIDRHLTDSVIVVRTENIGEPMMLLNPSNHRAAIVSTIESSFNQNLLDRIVSVNGLEINVDPSFHLD